MVPQDLGSGENKWLPPILLSPTRQDQLSQPRQFNEEAITMIIVAFIMEEKAGMSNPQDKRLPGVPTNSIQTSPDHQP